MYVSLLVVLLLLLLACLLAVGTRLLLFCVFLKMNYRLCVSHSLCACAPRTHHFLSAHTLPPSLPPSSERLFPPMNHSFFQSLLSHTQIRHIKKNKRRREEEMQPLSFLPFLNVVTQLPPSSRLSLSSSSSRRGHAFTHQAVGRLHPSINKRVQGHLLDLTGLREGITDNSTPSHASHCLNHPLKHCRARPVLPHHTGQLAGEIGGGVSNRPRAMVGGDGGLVGEAAEDGEVGGLGRVFCVIVSLEEKEGEVSRSILHLNETGAVQQVGDGGRGDLAEAFL